MTPADGILEAEPAVPAGLRRVPAGRHREGNRNGRKKPQRKEIFGKGIPEGRHGFGKNGYEMTGGDFPEAAVIGVREMQKMENTKQNETWYLGLDMGTNSLGWAVTDPEYNVIRKSGKALWGVRLFEEGETAAERRGFRTARRRTQRRSRRIDLLQELFAQAVAEKDPGFFQRLNDSRYLPEDKHVQQRNALFCDPGYTDKDYYKAYPTIYHLRKALMEEDGPFDVRLVYLAVHHIIKHRGHFLFDSFTVGKDGLPDSTEAFHAFQNAAEDVLGLSLPEEMGKEIADILSDRRLGVTRKSAALQEKFPRAKEKPVKNLIKLLAGGTVKLDELFADETLKDYEKNKLSLGDGDYDDKIDDIAETVGEDRFSLIEAAKQLYDWALLAELMGGCHTLSEAKVRLYEKHRADLKRLKALLRDDPKHYKEIFREAGKESYGAYVGLCIRNRKKMVIEKRASAEVFFDHLKKVLKTNPSPEAKAILEEIDAGQFLPKAVSKINGVIPHQLQEQELRKILERAEKYLPFLQEADQYGTVSDKIISLLTFRIPYYVGPLNTAHSSEDGREGFAWAVRREEGRILPWNFEEKIDTEKSAERFIRRMTNKCTYLLGEDVLPKNSLLYTEFVLLNELNNVRIGEKGQRLTEKQRNILWEELFLKHKKVTGKRFASFLVQEGWLEKEDIDTIRGIDGDFKSSLGPWIDMDIVFRGGEKPSRQVQEQLIRDITLFGDDRKMLEKVLREDVPSLTVPQLSALKKLRYRDWGRLSEKLLTGISAVDKETGAVQTLIEAMRTTGLNLMELLTDRFGYMEAISRENEKDLQGSALTYETVEQMRIPPAVRRSLWQTLSVVKELRHIMGCDPKRIFVEMARGGDAVKQRTKSRKEQLQELYKACGKDAREWSEKLEKTPEDALRRDKLYLYYTQMGRCMYTGEVIRLEDLENRDIYDIDHIYPQSLTADDSLDNRVLVRKNVNAAKSDRYPLAEEVRQSRHAFWKMLLDKGLISRTKYARLVRNTPLSADELASFIGRQLVETRQSTKAAAEILKKVFENADIVYAKAGNASRFRQTFGFLKVRDVNDFHHAKDAYINIVVGNIYFTKFTADPKHFFAEKNHTYTLNDAMYRYPVVRGGVTAWAPGEDGTIAAVRRWMRKNNILFTRYSFCQQGGLFDQLPVKKGKGQVPLKSDGSPIGNIEKYGGYNKAGVSYFMYVRAKEKKGKKEKTVYRFVPVLLYRAGALRTDEDRKAYCLEEWKRENKAYTEPEILLRKIKYNALLEQDGFRMHISGRSNDRLILKNAAELCLSEEEAALIKRMGKFLERENKNKEETVTAYDKIDAAQTLALYDTLSDKLERGVYRVKLGAQIDVVKKGREKFILLSLEKQCSMLMGFLHLFQCNPVLANLKEIGGSASAGTILINFNTTDQKGLTLIHQSVTGFFEKRIPLVPFGQP